MRADDPLTIFYHGSRPVCTLDLDPLDARDAPPAEMNACAARACHAQHDIAATHEESMS